MDSAIRDLFFGTHIKIDNIPMTDEYRDACSRAGALKKSIAGRLSADMQKEFEEFCEAVGKMNASSAEEHYVEGVKLGMRLGMEAGSGGYITSIEAERSE